MAEENNSTPHPEDSPPSQPIVYASPLKRIWAWVGVAYMVIIVLLMTYMFAKGIYLKGISGVMVCPAIAGIFASITHLWRTKGKSNLSILFVLLQALCVAAFVLSLMTGIPSLIANFGV